MSPEARRRHQDEALARAISPPARRAKDNDGLRSLVVGRLSPTEHKAVVRISLRGTRISAYCEGCRRWTGPLEEFPLEFDCACGRSYATETVIMEEVEPDDEEDEQPDDEAALFDIDQLTFDHGAVLGPDDVPPRPTEEEMLRLGRSAAEQLLDESIAENGPLTPEQARWVKNVLRET